MLLDVRDEDEYRAGYIPDAVHVTRGMLEFSVENYIPDRNQKVIVYCAAGLRSLLAAKSLREMGYTDTVSLAGGYRDWLTAGYPTAQDKPMSHEQLDRYSRHFMLTEVGEQGQAKLLDAKVLMVGAGGLGLTRGCLPRCRRCGTPRYHRLRCCGTQQPPTSDPSPHRIGRHPEGSIRDDDNQVAKSRHRHYAV